MYRSHLLRGVSVCVLTLAIVSSPAAQEALPEIDVGAAGQAPAPQGEAGAIVAPPGFSPEKLKLPVYRDPTGQTFTTVRTEDFKDSPLVTIRDLLQYSPGLSFKQGNGPRDIVISIRGSSARNGFGVRNIVLLEDGFSVTQPDGLSRTDLTDPHAYAAVDVYRGPSSALFGNFANGGAINFRTRTGAEIDGIETGHEFGSFGYINNYTAIGKNTGNFDIAVFASDVRQDGFILHHDGDTQTVNMTARYRPTPDDLIVFKGIHNELFGNLSTRLSLNQYYANPYQWGCNVVPRASNAFSSLIADSRAYSSMASREQEFKPAQARRDFIATIAATSSVCAGSMISTMTRNGERRPFTTTRTSFSRPAPPLRCKMSPPSTPAPTSPGTGTLQGHDITHFLDFYFNRTRYVSYTTNTLAFGDGAIGATTNKQNAMMQNMGMRGRQELALSPTSPWCSVLPLSRPGSARDRKTSDTAARHA